MNGVHPPKQIDHISPFSQPPAPPPQQPLPEKPDIARFSIPESPSQPSLKRTETEKPRSALDSPTRSEIPSGQIVSLLEALKSAKQEIDSQGDRVKHLEVALARERKAREQAERRARNLSGGRDVHEANGVGEVESFVRPLDSPELMEHDLPNGHIDTAEGSNSLSKSTTSISTIHNVEDTHRDAEDIDASTSRLQARLDLMVKEMDEMKMIMESYKQRAEVAEEGRRSLAEMVESIRTGRDPKTSVPSSNDDESVLVENGNARGAVDSNRSTHSNDLAHSHSSSQQVYQHANGNAAIDSLHQELEKTVSEVLQQQRRWGGGAGEGGSMVQSAPYVSMVGVVLIGVGIMTWLNGWQPGGER